ncbi:transposase [Oscillatoria sp. FACHB-1406]|uniref:transposase n=1 Tax=Oscillatoria sp. FACHB-1406 TaxID=2692846 RepID=UPI001F55278E|nr:transposase [Oscillatoria sp. FACHB-1406]
MIIEKLKQFRQQIYEDLGKARDALFELMDALVLTPKASSIAELSLCPVFRRRWSSIYESLKDSNLDFSKLQKHYIAQIPSNQQIVLVGDHTSWSRPDAVTLQERTYEHAGGGIGGGKPITVGQGYSSLAWIPEEKGSWALPLSHC